MHTSFAWGPVALITATPMVIKINKEWSQSNYISGSLRLNLILPHFPWPEDSAKTVSLDEKNWEKDLTAPQWQWPTGTGCRVDAWSHGSRDTPTSRFIPADLMAHAVEWNDDCLEHLSRSRHSSSAVTWDNLKRQLCMYCSWTWIHLQTVYILGCCTLIHVHSFCYTRVMHRTG